VVVVVESDERGAQPWMVAVDGGGEGFAEVSAVDSGERFVGVGSPGLLAQAQGALPGSARAGVVTAR
jgi:hypothetical protein